jgi:hypothetical protein
MHLKNLYKISKRGLERPSVHGLKAILPSIAANFDNIFIVGDALDECPDTDNRREELLRLINDIHCQSLKNVHMLVTSREKADIEETLRPLSTIPPICMQDAGIEADIAVYVKRQLASHHFKHWPEGIKRDVELTLVRESHGM